MLQCFKIAINGKALNFIRFEDALLQIVGQSLHTNDGTVAPLMNICDHFVDIVAGFDLGYSNGFLYHTKTRPEKSVYEIIGSVRNSAMIFEKQIQKSKSIPEIIGALEYLASGYSVEGSSSDP